MEHKNTTTCSEPLRYALAHEPAHTLLRHCEERLEGEGYVTSAKDVIERNKRRGNLPSLIHWEQLFIGCSNPLHYKVTAGRLSRGCSKD